METRNITSGKELSVYWTDSISLGESKKENRDGIKVRFAILKAKDQFSGIASASTIPLFEGENISTEGYEELMRCRKLDSNNQPAKDPKGGFIVDMLLLREGIVKRRAESAKNKIFDDDPVFDPYGLDKILRIDGAMPWTYEFPDGPHYVNEQDGKMRMRDGKPVIATSCSILVQVKFVDGNGEYHFVEGWEPERRGRRVMNTFFKERVQTASAVVQPIQPQQVQPEGQAQVTQLPPIQPVQQQGVQPVQPQGQGVVMPQQPEGPGF